jgi:GNAT superfamily N-acetyltransferase
LPLAQSYVAAYWAMQSMPFHRLIVAVDGERIIGTTQLMITPALLSRGSWRGQIEAVRIAANLRGQGKGQAFVDWAIEQRRSTGCVWVQLVSDSSRSAAHHFWRKLGFVSSHIGFKLKL